MKEVKYESKWLEHKEKFSFCKYATIILQLGDKIRFLWEACCTFSWPFKKQINAKDRKINHT